MCGVSAKKGAVDEGRNGEGGEGQGGYDRELGEQDDGKSRETQSVFGAKKTRRRLELCSVHVL